MKILDYELEELIGRGAFSEVYRARRGDGVFAVKLLRPPAGSDRDDLVARLRFEFWLLKDLLHPHIVAVFDFGELPDGAVFLVEEWIDGPDLKKFCAGRAFTECADAFAGVLKALRALHSWNIRHGDIKPENVLVAKTPQGFTAKLLDFGLAFPNKDKNSSLSGTLSTLAPELILGREGDARADLYAAGVTFYESLTGKNPFVRATPEETLAAHLGFAPEPVALVREDVTPSWNALIAALLAKNPDDRPSGADKALALVGAGGFAPSPPPLIGRERELGVLDGLRRALTAGMRVGVTASGAPGSGVARFLRELFYRLVAAEPGCRGRVAFGEDEARPETLVLLLDRKPVPAGFRASEVNLGAFTAEETRAWARAVLGVRNPPEKFLRQLHRRSRGLPGAAWEIISRLHARGLLTDAAGAVTATVLERIDWGREFGAAGKPESDAGFDDLLSRAREKLGRRELRAEDAVMTVLQWAVGEAPEEREARRRKALLLSLTGAVAAEAGSYESAREDLSAAAALLGTEKEWRAEKARADNYLAAVALRQGKVAEAVTAYEAVRDALAGFTGDEKRRVGNFDLGYAYLQAGRHAEAVEFISEQLSRAEAEGERARRLFCLYNLALARQGLGDDSGAKSRLEELAALAREAHDAAYLLRARNALGNVLARLGDEGGAESAYGEALELALALRDETSAATAAQNRGELRLRRGRHDEARADLELSLKLLERRPARYGFEKTLLCRALTELGGLFRRRGEFQAARDALERAWHMAESDPDLENYRFWILAGRCRLWLAEDDAARLRAELPLLAHHARDGAQKKEADELRAEFKSRAARESEGKASRSESELRAILRVNRDLAGEMPLDELLRRILGHALELTGAELGVILLLDETGAPRPAFSLNARLDDDLGEVSLSVARRALETGACVRTSDASADGDFNQYASVVNLNLRSLLGVPVVFRGEALGVLYLSHRRRAGLFDARVTAVAEAFADQAALALKNHALLEFHKRAGEELKTELQETERALLLSESQLKATSDEFAIELKEGRFVTRSPKLAELLTQARRLARTTISTLLHGESGTGKEVFARYLHQSSARRDGPFVAVNCGALPQALVESELFGHRRGAFTGADRDRTGLVEAAHGGTLFLDEIADLPPPAQVKLLRVLQEREVTRVGETQPKAVDVRVVAASHVPLKKAVAEGRFREDLYYRLAGVELTLPPLRERREDIPLLAGHFARAAFAAFGRKGEPHLAPSLMRLFLDYDWPGNIRELKNAVEAAAALSSGRSISEKSLPKDWHDRLLARFAPAAGGEGKAAGWYDPRKTWREHELRLYASALAALEFDIGRAAKSLGVGIATVYKQLRENRLRDNRARWEREILPYREGTTLAAVRRHVFGQAARRHEGHPYRAARELGVAPATFYRYARGGEGLDSHFKIF